MYKYEFRKKCYRECPIISTSRENSTELEKFPFDKNYFCKPNCDKENPFEIIYTQECVKNCPIKYIKDKSCILNFQIANSKNEENKQNIENENIKAHDIIINSIEEEFTSNDYNTSNLENGNDEVIEYEQMTITITTAESQKNDSKNKNVTNIDLGECEYILKEVYNISNEDVLFIIKKEVKQEGMKIPKIEFDVFSYLKTKNLIKLNLSYCSQAKIDLSIPIIISENIDKINSSSGYYNDLCYTATSENGTDITLKDRQKEFITNNKTVCQENCLFSDYNYDIQKAKCKCDVVGSSSSFANIKIDTKKLYKNFVDIKNIANVNY